jgi:hypothetical protein
MDKVKQCSNNKDNNNNNNNNNNRPKQYTDLIIMIIQFVFTYLRAQGPIAELARERRKKKQNTTNKIKTGLFIIIPYSIFCHSVGMM